MIAVIPARFASARLPGKLMLDLGGRALILHTLEQASNASLVDRVIVATDDSRIFDVVRSAGGEAVMTSSGHASGSDRIAEVAENLPGGSIVVNVQGDEPFIAPETIDAVAAALLADRNADIATACETISDISQLYDPNVVKVVFGENGNALYFSRSPVPFPRDAVIRHGDPKSAIVNEPELLRIFRKHTGIYAYRREYLLAFSRLPQTKLEKIEMLEQLRALENGAKIKVVEAHARSIGIDTEEDLAEARREFEARSVTIRPAAVGDVPQIAGVHVESWQRSFKGIAPEDYLNSLSKEKRERAFTERLFENGYKLFVAESKTAGVIGFIDFGRPGFENFGYDVRIYSFYLLPEFQRRGIGARLFKQCFTEIARHGYSSACLDTLEMSPYRRFYEKHGGTEVARDKHMLGGREFVTIIYGWDDVRQ